MSDTGEDESGMDSDEDKLARSPKTKSGTKTPQRVSFTTFETELLFEFVSAKKKIVEDKNTGFINLERKRKAWEQIRSTFNSSAETTPRTVEQLKKRWENLKSRAKKDISKQKRCIRKTGGGPAPPAVSKFSEKVAEIVPMQMEGSENPFDSDVHDSSKGTNGGSVPQCDTSLKDVGLATEGSQTTAGTSSASSKKPSVDKDDEATKGKSTNGSSGLDKDKGENGKNSETIAKKARAKSDPRSALAEWEYEEHTTRMKTLSVAFEAEVFRREKAQLEVQQSTELHKLQKELLMAQIKQLENTTILLPQLLPNNN